jgi:hypothetical protein
MIATRINPNGFQNNAPKTSPLINDKTDLVDPQEGQGILVTLLNKHTPNSSSIDALRLYVIKSQIYPATQAVDKRAYNLFLLIRVNIENVVFFACFFPGLLPES